MKTIYKTLLTCVIALIINPLYLIVSHKGLSFRNLSDLFFLLALLFFMIGAFIAILSSGFFDLFQKNMKQISQQRKKNEPKEYLVFSQIFKNKPYYWLCCGLFFSLIAFILGLLI